MGQINQEATSFTASLSRLGAIQTPNEYENENGEKLPAIPMGKRGANPSATTGVELSFTITPEASLEIKAITAADLEAKRLEEEAATAAAVKKRLEAEAAAKAKSKQLTRGQLLVRALKQCKKSKSKHKRVQCEKLAKKKYGGQQKPKTHKK